MKRNPRGILPMAALACLALASCLPAFLGEETGSVSLTISDSMSAPSPGARTIAPAGTDITVVEYGLSADGPDPHSVAIDDCGTSPVLDGLAIGSWTIDILGKNASGNAVTSGRVTVAVTAGGTVSETVTMGPVSGDGTYSFTITWPAGSGIGVTACSLAPAGGGTAVTPGVTTSIDRVVYSGDIPAGMYDFSVTLSCNGASVTVFEQMQIYGGLESTKTIDLTAADFSAPPAAPGGLAAAASGRTVALTWTDNSNTENRFLLERSIDGGSTWTVLTEGLAPNSVAWTDSTLSTADAAGTYAASYLYRLRASNGIGNSGASSCAFTPNRITGMTLEADYALHVGGTRAMTATVTPPNAFDDRVTWFSSAPSVATVDASTGVVSAVAIGSANIGATTADGGFTDTCTVTACAAPLLSAFGFTAALNGGAGIYEDRTGVITGGRVDVTVPYGSVVTGLIATFEAAGTGVTVGGASQESGTTSNDFTSEKTYVVSAADGATRSYAVRVAVAAAAGSFWTERTVGGAMAGQSRRGIAGSLDGTKLVATSYNYDYLYTSADGGATWTRRDGAGKRDWRSVDCSADGGTILAGSNYGYLYVSTDGGATWTERQPVASTSKSWYGVASSSDGTKLAAAANGGYIYTSTDGGATWTERTGSGSYGWYDVAGSADGSKLVAAASTGYLYTSDDGGLTWYPRCVSDSWQYVTSSADGTMMAASRGYGYLFFSNDGGVTWNRITGIPDTTNSTYGYGYSDWECLAISADGTSLVAASGAIPGHYVYTGAYDAGTESWSWTKRPGAGARIWYGGAAVSQDGSRICVSANNEHLHTSTDGGATWTERSGAGSRTWNDIAVSPDGTKAAAVFPWGSVVTSADGGATWTERSALGIRPWTGITVSADGWKLAACAGISGYSEYVYTSADGGVTWTRRTAPGSNSWADIEGSSDGSVLAAAESSGQIWISMDGGATWSEQTASPMTSSKGWSRLAVSPGGDKMAAVVSGGYIYTASWSGSAWTWTERTGVGATKTWKGITMSSNGTILTAAAMDDYIWRSVNGGGSWTQLAAGTASKRWMGITGSADGLRLAAAIGDTSSVSYPGTIWTTADGGTTWTERTGAGTRLWKSMACSADGEFLAAGADKDPNLFTSGSNYYDIPVTVE